MASSVSVLPDGSVVVTDGNITYPPLSPQAVQAVAGVASVSANASNTQAITEGLQLLAHLITEAGPAAGSSAYAQVTVTPGQAIATLDAVSFALVQQYTPLGRFDSDGNWAVGPLVLKKKPDPGPAPAPDPIPGPGGV